MIEVVEYVSEDGKNAFQEFLQSLDSTAFARVFASVKRMEEGNFGDVKSLGGGASETRIHAGPGYRIYFSRDGVSLVILLAGGTKKKQSCDISAAQANWAAYKATKHRK